jgi:hypothetical protein
MTEKNPRQYNGMNVQKHGTPRVAKFFAAGDSPPCPYCGCLCLAQCEVDVEDSRLTTGHGKGVYLGCPACPWAGPMATMAVPKPQTKEST